MKEFKKWWSNQFSSRKGNNNSHLGYPEAHQAWQAALEWVKDRSEVAKGLYMISVNDIDKELEE